MHDTISSLPVDLMEEGNSPNRTMASFPPSTRTRSQPNSSLLSNNSKLRKYVYRVSIYIYNHIALLSLHRYYLRRLHSIREGTGPQPRVQEKIIVRDKTAAHAMKRLNNEALLLCPLSIAVLMLGAMESVYIASRTRVALVQYIGAIAFCICLIGIGNTATFVQAFSPWIPTFIHGLVIRANTSELNRIAQVLASLPAFTIWGMISVLTAPLLDSVQSWLPSHIQHHPANPTLLLLILNPLVFSICWLGLIAWLFTVRIKFVYPLTPIAREKR